MSRTKFIDGNSPKAGIILSVTLAELPYHFKKTFYFGDFSLTPDLHLHLSNHEVVWKNTHCFLSAVGSNGFIFKKKKKSLL